MKHQLTLFGILLIANQLSAQSVEPMMPEEPVLIVKIRMVGVSSEIRINDIPVYERRGTGTPSSTSRIINRYYTPNENRLSVDIAPPINNSEYTLSGMVDVRLVIAENVVANVSRIPDGAEIELARIKLDIPSEDMLASAEDLSGRPYRRVYGVETNYPLAVEVGSIVVEESKEFAHGIKISRDIKTNVQFPRWKWIDSDVINNTDETKASLLHEYMRLWTLIKNQSQENYERYREILKEASEEVKQSKYVSIRKNSSKNSFEKPTEERKSEFDLKLQPINKDDVHLRLYGEGRLAELVSYRKGHGYGAILWYGAKNIPARFGSKRFIFRRENGKWIATR